MSNFILAAQVNPALVPAVMLIALFVLAFGSVIMMAIFEAYRNQPRYTRTYRHYDRGYYRR
jgi:hypothetical protein